MSSDKENVEEEEEFDVTQRMEVRKKYKSILEGLSTGDDNDSQYEEGYIKQAMEEVETLFHQIETPQEALLDSKVFLQLSTFCRQYAECLSTNAQNFVISEFADKLFDSVGGNVDEESGVIQTTPQQWARLGAQTHQTLTSAPYLRSLLGSLDKGEYQPKVRAEKAKRGPKPDQGSNEATKASIITNDESDETKTNKKTRTEILVESTYQQAVKYFKKNGKRPICYFKFVVDSNDFGQTVENMFHVSFLVKEGKVRIFIGEDGFPKIELVKASRGETQISRSKRQVVATISPPMWRNIVEKLGIRGSMINHDEAVLA